MKKTPFGDVGVVSNPAAVHKKVLWVVGDSFTQALRPYFNQTFAEVHYLGHISDLLLNRDEPALMKMLKDYPNPDVIVFIRVERAL